MKKKLSKIVISGGNGRFASVLKKTISSKNYFFPNKKKLNILKPESIEKYLKKIKPKYFIHAAALSRPMKIHETQISKSIDLNIIGTCNVVKICKKLKIKLIYFSTGYVYPGIKGNYKEHDPLKPINNYALSKLGGECAVKMYEFFNFKNNYVRKTFLQLCILWCKNKFYLSRWCKKQIPKLINKSE